MTLGALLNTTTEVMKSTHANRTLWAVVGYQTELGFIAEGDLLFNSFHARICPGFLLLAKFANCHAGSSLLVAIKIFRLNLIVTFTH